jgi:hypothetical protein
MPIKMIVMVKRRPGLSRENFRKGYETSHSRIAVELFGHLWLSYSRNYLISGHCFGEGMCIGASGGPDEVGFDAVSEIVFADRAALEEMGRIASKNFKRIKDDEALWFDQEKCWTMTCETLEEDLAVSSNIS